MKAGLRPSHSRGATSARFGSAFTLALLLLALAGLTSTCPAWARGHGGGGHGSGGHGGGHGSSGSSGGRPAGFALASTGGAPRAGYGVWNGRGVWNGGSGSFHHHGHHGGFAFFYFGTGWGYYPYDYLDTYPPAVSLIQPADVIYIQKPELDELEAASPHWYYCYEPAGYYPSVTECSGDWYPMPQLPDGPSGP
jgi:hypothetical protein